VHCERNLLNELPALIMSSTEQSETASQEARDFLLLAKKAVLSLGSLKLASILLLLLLLLTWFSTLEQVVSGLYPMLEKYFSPKSFFIYPEIGRPFQEEGEAFETIRVPIPLPGGYWVCVLFTINLIIGGLVRIKKSAKKTGIILSHFSIVFLMISAAVTERFEKRGAMVLYEGEISNVATMYHNQVIEVTELENGKPVKVHQIPWEQLKKLRSGKQKTYTMVNLPFDIRVDKFYENATPLSANFFPPSPESRAEIRGGFYLQEDPPMESTELHQGAAAVTILSKDKKVIQKELLAMKSYYPASLMYQGKTYSLEIRKEFLQVPFKLRLDKFSFDTDPGTSRAAAFESDVTRFGKAGEERYEIVMNQPLRHDGWVFFQARYSEEPRVPGGQPEFHTILEVVNNPSDQWPKYTLYLSTVALIGHFLVMLVKFSIRSYSPSKS